MWVKPKIYRITPAKSFFLYIISFCTGFVIGYFLYWSFFTYDVAVFWSMIGSISSFTAGVIALYIGLYPTYKERKSRPRIMFYPYELNESVLDENNTLHFCFHNTGETTAKNVQISIFGISPAIEQLLFNKKIILGDIQSKESASRPILKIFHTKINFILFNFEIPRRDYNIIFQISGDNIRSYIEDLEIKNNENPKKIKFYMTLPEPFFR